MKVRIAVGCAQQACLIKSVSCSVTFEKRQLSETNSRSPQQFRFLRHNIAYGAVFYFTLQPRYYI